MTFNEVNTVEALIRNRLAELCNATNVRPLGLI